MQTRTITGIHDTCFTDKSKCSPECKYKNTCIYSTHKERKVEKCR